MQVALALASLPLAVRSDAADVAVVRELLGKGAYAEAAAEAEAGERGAPKDVEWPLLRAKALGESGQVDAVLTVIGEAVDRFPLDIRVRLAAYEALRRSPQTDAAHAQRLELERLARGREWAYRAPAERVALGKLALLIGGDPKRVLELFYDPVRKAHPDFRETYLASGELALEKSDFALAAKTFAAATKKFPEDAEVWFGLARAYAPSDFGATLEAVGKTLKLNPNHAGAWLLLADQHISAENYTEAEAAIAAALKTNPNHSAAHSYRAVLARLREDAQGERDARAAALKFWPQNPEVPHLIGRKLSQSYRFAEGAVLQREALAFDPKFLPAKAQLANDLLRLGEDEEGWKLAAEVQAADPYDVIAYNLTTLRDAMAHFQTLSSEHFTLRMDPREAHIYGADALALLERAHATLTKKYGLDLRERTIVEIFPDQKDFAIRTFGLPGGAGYLGVCFGRVITANSPASRAGSPSNWKAILWHEFTHVVTLTLTKNKMPRWLSEGISVFEERQARTLPGNARGSWGEQMKPRYRAMILGDDLTPVSQLSGAFLKPKTPAHLGFAYYESSLVVEWLMEKWGIDRMKRCLADLAAGKPINAALTANFAPIDQLDAEFKARAMAIAKNTGPKLDWTPPRPAQVSSEKALAEFAAANPNNFTALTEQAKALIRAKKWAEAKPPLQSLITLYPDAHDRDGAHAMLARVHRELGETAAEFTVLRQLADLAPDATEAFSRLMKLATDRKDWTSVLDFAGRSKAVDPLRPEPHQSEARAAEETGHKTEAINAYRTLLRLEPADPAEVHFRLARLLHQIGDASAKRHVVLALEEAPRFGAALDLLLELSDPSSSAQPPTDRPQ